MGPMRVPVATHVMKLSPSTAFPVTIAILFPSHDKVGDIKVINFFMRKDYDPNSELQNILMGLVFKILAQTKRIFLFTRPTDSEALEMYAAMGFERDENPFQDPSHKINHQYLASLDYRIENSKILQRTVVEMEDAFK